jgi:hypothetical protein
MCLLALTLAGQSAGPAGLTIADVKVTGSSFNPSKSESVTLTFNVSGAARLTARVVGPDREYVRTILDAAQQPAGAVKVVWNGRDQGGRVVPNEAYFFTIEAEAANGEKAVYDPVTFSGGEFADVTQGQVSRRSGTVSYQLSQPSRVLMRAGIAGNSMLKTIVDWEPRSAGAITEYWNGKDGDNLIDVLNLKYTMILSYMTLPESSVITFGNNNYDYRAYRGSLKSPPASKPDRPMANSRQISPHFLKSRIIDRSFKVKLSFPELNNGATSGAVPPAARDRILVRLDVDPKDREILQNQQFEIILFVDTVFHIEEERGYLPFNVPIELTQLPAGEHVITANLITFGDQIGVGSRKIRVDKQ